MKKIILVHWKGGLTKWYPFTLKTLEILAESMCGIDLIEIVHPGHKNTEDKTK